jgi:hypothetical protein
MSKMAVNITHLLKEGNKRYSRYLQTKALNDASPDEAIPNSPASRRCDRRFERFETAIEVQDSAITAKLHWFKWLKDNGTLLILLLRRYSVDVDVGVTGFVLKLTDVKEIVGSGGLVSDSLHKRMSEHLEIVESLKPKRN